MQVEVVEQARVVGALICGHLLQVPLHEGFAVVILAILLPVTFLIQAILAGNSGPLVQVLTWVPLWTPFTDTLPGHWSRIQARSS